MVEHDVLELFELGAFPELPAIDQEPYHKSNHIHHDPYLLAQWLCTIGKSNGVMWWLLDMIYVKATGLYRCGCFKQHSGTCSKLNMTKKFNDVRVKLWESKYPITLYFQEFKVFESESLLWLWVSGLFWYSSDSHWLISNLFAIVVSTIFIFCCCWFSVGIFRSCHLALSLSAKFGSLSRFGVFTIFRQTICFMLLVTYSILPHAISTSNLPCYSMIKTTQFFQSWPSTVINGIITLTTQVICK